MRLRTERGEGKLGSFIWLAVVIAGFWAAFKVFPVYMANYALDDKMVEVARLPRGQNPDEKIVDILMKEVREQELDAYVQRSDFKVDTAEHARRISLEYERVVEVLPGWKRTFHFTHKVDQPLVY